MNDGATVDAGDGAPVDVGDGALDGVIFRSILSSDFEEIKLLHEVFFPVRYSDQFYIDTCSGKGMRGGVLYSSVAVSQGRIVGFALAQIMSYPAATEDKDLFPGRTHSPRYACYILTLGIVDEFRRRGLGTALIRHCEEHAAAVEDCGAVYLHVITSNAPAIRFYERNKFTRLRSIDNFYYINKEYFSCHLYILYIDQQQGSPSRDSDWINISNSNNWISAIRNFASELVSNMLMLFFRRHDQGDASSASPVVAPLAESHPLSAV